MPDTSGHTGDRGWGWPRGSRSAHWFDETGESLCHRWGFFSGYAEPNPPKTHACKACQRALDRNNKSAGRGTAQRLT